jgi:hypothetical protein
MTFQLLIGRLNQPKGSIQKGALAMVTTAVCFVAITYSSNAKLFATEGGTGGTNHPPVIFNFTASNPVGNYWTFSGQVTDDQNVNGLVVTLGGLPSLNGVTTTVNAQGWFSVTVQLGPNESGTATAQTTDAGGLASNVAWTIVN